MTTGSVAPPLETSSPPAAGWVLVVSVAAMGLGLNIIAPALPLFGRDFGVGTALLGLLITAFGVGRLILNFPAGILADRIGRRAVLLGSPIVVCLTAGLAALAQTFPQLVVLRFLQGAGSAFFTTAAMAAMVDLGGVGRRGRALSVFQGSLLVGASVGPAVGGLLTAHWGLRAPFVAYAALALGCAIWIYLQVPEVAASGRVVENVPLRAALRGVAHRDFLLVVIVTFAVFLTRAGGRSTILPLLAYDRLHLGPSQVGLILSVIALINILVLYPTGALSDRFGRKALIVPGLTLTATALVLVGIANTYSMLVIYAILWGIGTGIDGPSPAAYMADLVSPGRIGMVMGLFRTAGDVGFVIGPMLLGWVADIAGYTAAMLTNAAIVVAAVVPFALFAREHRTVGAAAGGGMEGR